MVRDKSANIATGHTEEPRSDCDVGSESNEKFFPEVTPGNRLAAEMTKLGEYRLQQRKL